MPLKRGGCHGAGGVLSLCVGNGKTRKGKGAHHTDVTETSKREDRVAFR